MIALFLFIFLLNFQEVCKIDYIKENLRVESCKPSCCVTSKQYLEKLQPSKCWHYCTGTISPQDFMQEATHVLTSQCIIAIAQQVTIYSRFYFVPTIPIQVTNCTKIMCFITENHTIYGTNLKAFMLPVITVKSLIAPIIFSSKYSES